MEEGQLVAGVLQLPEGVGGDDGGGAAVDDVVVDDLLDQTAHDRVEAVEGLVEEQVVGHGGQGQDGGGLTAHTLGEGVQIGLGIQPEGLGEIVEALTAEPLVQGVVVGRHLLHVGLGEEVEVVGDVEDLVLGGGILPDGEAVHLDTAAVGAVDTREQAEEGGLTRAVGANQAVDAGAGNGTGQVVQRDMGLGLTCGAEDFGDVLGLDHEVFPPSWVLGAAGGLFPFPARA